MSALDQMTEMYPIVNLAANDFLGEMSNTNIKRDIAIAAQMAGLKLLRASNVDLSKSTPGAILLGAIKDETYNDMQRFILSWSRSNGLFTTGIIDPNIPDDAKNYYPEVSSMEEKFENHCKHHNLGVEFFPFVATTSALKMVVAGKQMNILDPQIGLSMTIYHILSGSKTVPYPDTK